jgi:hypothetical protein
LTRKGQISLGLLVGTLLAMALVTSAEMFRHRRSERLMEAKEEGGGEQ